MNVIHAMIEAGDVDALLVVLRRAPYASDRLRAARALGEIADADASPELIDAALADEDAGVRSAASRALQVLLGAEHLTALEFARSSGGPDPLEAPDEYELEVLASLEGGETDAIIDERDLPGLVLVLQSESDRKIRLHAIHALRGMPGLQVYRILGELALWEEDREVKAAAHQALETMLGDDLPEFLEGLRKEWTGEDELEDDEMVLEVRAAGEMNPAAGPPKSWDLPKDSQVMREEGTPLWVWVLLGLVLLGAVWFVFLR